MKLFTQNFNDEEENFSNNLHSMCRLFKAQQEWFSSQISISGLTKLSNWASDYDALNSNNDLQPLDRRRINNREEAKTSAYMFPLENPLMHQFNNEWES